MSSHEQQRQKMVEGQLRSRNITDPAVLSAMERVPRERFVPEKLREQSHSDQALSISCGQTISQPFIVGLMTQALRLTGRELVLEVGTGSGYQTAILAELADYVVSIERHADLAKAASGLLTELGYENFEVHVGDGTVGWPGMAPYDRILVAAGGPEVPPALLDQLKDPGILVLPIGDQEKQMLKAIHKINGQVITRDLSGCRFVKLIGEQGWQEVTGGE